MKRFITAVLAAVALPAMAQEVTLKLHHIWPPQAMAPVRVIGPCLLYTSPSPRDRTRSRMPSSA